MEQTDKYQQDDHELPESTETEAERSPETEQSTEAERSPEPIPSATGEQAVESADDQEFPLDGEVILEKSEEEAMAERMERQEDADKQAESLREAELQVQAQVESTGVEPVIVIKGLCKSFQDHEVLRGVDLHVNKGENLVILGKSGTGKSVLIKCLVGLVTPDEGEIRIFGEDLLSLKYGELNGVRIRTGFLFQNAALYDSMTVRENLLFPLRQHKKDMSREKKNALVMEMLDNVGLVDQIDQLPSKLSGGQNKRIGLARTLILRPELMLYDEPTTGLDTGTGKEISELMIRMQKKYNISSITITHDMTCAKMTADRIIMLKEGVVVAEGTYEELEKSPDEWVSSFFH
jgi:phospholipid/cholesterol/gamma-HCH transport system ATP-binding protein